MLACLIFLLATSLFARPKSDIELADVDVLIAEQRINEAFALIEKYIRENPLDFDNAQKRVNNIFESRNAYKSKADELLRVIVEEPLNDAKKLEIIAELEAMEKNPNEEEKRFIRETKISAQFTYYRALFEQIMVEGAELLAQKQYTAATKRFSDGFILYYDDFFELGFDPAFVSSVEEYLEDITNSLTEYDQIQNGLLDAFTAFNLALAAYDIEGALVAYPNLKQQLSEYAQLRNVTLLGGSYFRDAVPTLQEEFPELTEAFFLPFAYRLLLGRESDDSIGIITVIDTQWEDLYVESQKLLTAMIEYHSDEMAQKLSGRTVNQLAADSSILHPPLVELTEASTLGKDFLELSTLLNDSPTTFMENPHATYVSALDYNQFLVSQAQALLEYSNMYVVETIVYNDRIVPANPDALMRSGNAEYIDFLIGYADTNTTFIQNADAVFFGIEEVRSSIHGNAIVFAGLENPFSRPWENFSVAVEQGFELLSAESYNEVLLSWEALSSFLARGSDIIREEYELPYSEAIPFINENLDTALLSYPAESLLALENIMLTLVDNRNLLQVQYDFLGTAPESPIIQNPGSNLYAADKNAILDDINFLNSIENSAPRYIALAEERVILARQAENEGRLRFSQAQAALDQEDFDESRDSLVRAREKYNESLLYQESAELRVQTDLQLSALGVEITRIENARVIADVRQLITSSRAQYYNSDFERAESLILQAESRWAVTNIESNAEVVALKALIGNALSIKTGRVILPTDPLYPEMSQTLNIAYQYYEQGEQLFLQGNRSNGLEQLNLARERIRDVQFLYPFNQEASLLALQIDKLIDPIAFEELFEQKYKTAQVEYREPDTTTRAYVDLLDLYEINPYYPGLEGFIYLVEIELGILIPPPDPVAINRSIELTREATRLYDSGARDEISLNNALSMLNEAITLNSENQDAMILSDRINIGLGGQSLVVLPGEMEALYQRAVQELSRGNILTAATIVEQLWQNTEMHRSPKIIDLKQRVDSLL